MHCGYRFVERPESEARGAVAAIIILFVGVLVTLAASSFWTPETYASNAQFFFSHLFTVLGFLACGLLALPFLGRNAVPMSLGDPCNARAVGAGLLIGAIGFGFSVAYTESLIWIFSDGAPPQSHAEAFQPSVGILWIVAALLPAFNEEWTDRGVLWLAVMKIGSPRMAIVCTALLFAFMHGLGGTFVFEFPHRFAIGLAFGFLRYRTNSLWPGIAGHALHNSLAIFLFSA